MCYDLGSKWRADVARKSKKPHRRSAISARLRPPPPISARLRSLVQLKLRFSEYLRRQLEQAAAQNRRSMNAEIINRLEASFSAKKSNARLVAEAFLGLHHGDELADELGRITDELKGRHPEVYEDYAYDEYSDELNRRREEEAEPAKQDKENEPK